MSHRPTPRRRWPTRLAALALALLAGLTTALVSTAAAQAGDHSPFPWTLQLTASRYTVPMSQNVLLSVESNYNLDMYSGSVWVQIYDRRTGLKVGGCNTGTLCQATLYNPVGYSWTHDYVAIASGPSDTIPSFRIAESGPVFVTWSGSGYTLQMTKSTGYVYAWANKLVDGYGVLEIRNVYTNALLTSCSTGFVCYAPVTFGGYVAYLVPWGIAASSNTLYY